MAKTKLNIDLLKRLRMRFLRMRHPEHFDMSQWGHKDECGTVACIAGHALLLSGYKLRRRNSGPFYQYVSPAGRVVRPSTAARRELGITQTVAGRLFYGSFDDARQAAARIQELIESAEKEN